MDEVALVRKLRTWASSPPPSHERKCREVIERINALDLDVRGALEALKRPAESQAFCDKARHVYSNLLKCMEAENPAAVQQLMQGLLNERNEVKNDIAFLKDRLKSLRVRHRILRCLAPSREEARQMNARELRLCLHIHKLPQLSNLVDKQDILDQLERSGAICG